MAVSTTISHPAGPTPHRQRAKHALCAPILFRLLAVAFGLALALLILETGLRLWGWPAPGFYQAGRGPMLGQTPTAEGGYWRAYPGSGRLRHYDYDIPVHINRHGFRERDNVPKTPGEWRIGLFGDSVTAGIGVGKEERFGAVWFADAQETLPNATLWNFGAPWCGTWQNADFLAAGAEEYELDEIILAVFGGNELQDNARWSKLRHMSRAELRKHDERGRGLRRWLRNHCRVATFVWIKVVRVLASRNPRGYVTSLQEVTTAWPHTQRALTAFQEAVGDRPFTIWYLPNIAEWDDAVWQSYKGTFDLRDSERFALRDRIAEWAAANHVPMVDTTVWLAGKSVGDLKLPVDPHWNAKGHQLVGAGLSATSQSSYHLRRNHDRARSDG